MMPGPAGAGPRGEGRHPSPPAIVTEYMAAGSLRAALNRKADWLNSSMAKVKVMLDAARVRGHRSLVVSGHRVGMISVPRTAHH